MSCVQFTEHDALLRVDIDVLAEDGSKLTPDGDILCSWWLYSDDEQD